MADLDPVRIAHPVTGQQATVTVRAFTRIWQPKGWTLVVGEELPPPTRAPRVLDEATSIAAQAGITAVVALNGLAVHFTVTDLVAYVCLLLPRVQLSAAGTAGLAGIADPTNLAAPFAFGPVEGVRTNGLAQAWVVEEIEEPGTYDRVGTMQRTVGAGTILNGFDAATLVARMFVTERPPLAFAA